MNINGLTVFYFVFGFFALILIIGSLIMYILWRRRKLIFTNFLAKNGQWEKKSWMPDEIDKTFEYDAEHYEYDIELCTRDRLNRPVAHYYKGNPKQQIFDFKSGSKSIPIGTYDITPKDFRVLMLSKVLRDIFQDEEVMQWLLIILVAVIGGALLCAILIFTHNPAVTLSTNNQTANIITNACRIAFTKK